mgnify:CR=1 FL=1
MPMKRKSVEWLASPADDDEAPADGYELHFRLAADWFAVDSDQLILPITVLDKTTIDVQEPYPAILKQYGGEGLLNDMLLSDGELEQGSEWYLIRTEQRLDVEPV